MKKYIIALVALTAAASVLAQGTVNFSTRVTGVVVGHIYGTEGPGGAVSKLGNTATETPVGTQVYLGGILTGSGYSAQLFAGAGAGLDQSALAAVSGVASLRTGSSLGGTPATSVVVIPGVATASGVGTFQIIAWDNKAGTLTTWAQAEAAWKAGTIAAGKSATFGATGLGDGGLNLPGNLENFRSFNIYFVPEPSTFALLGLGALGMLFIRRK